MRKRYIAAVMALLAPAACPDVTMVSITAPQYLVEAAVVVDGVRVDTMGAVKEDKAVLGAVASFHVLNSVHRIVIEVFK